MAILKYSDQGYNDAKEKIKDFKNYISTSKKDFDDYIAELKGFCSDVPVIEYETFFETFTKVNDSFEYLSDLSKRLSDLVDYEKEIVNKYSLSDGKEIDDFQKSLLLDVRLTSFNNDDDDIDEFRNALNAYYQSEDGLDWMTWLKDYIAGGFITSEVINMEDYLEKIKECGAEESSHWKNFLITGEEATTGGGEPKGGNGEEEIPSFPPGDTSWPPVEPSPTPEPTPEPTPSGSNDPTPTGSKDPKPSGSDKPNPTPTKSDYVPDPTPTKSDYVPDPTPTKSDYVPDPTPKGSNEPDPTPGPGPDPGHSGGGYSGGGYTPSGDGEDAVVPDSIEDVIDDAKSYTKIPRQIKIDGKNTKTSGGSVVPIIAGLTSVGAAGLGAKAYLDHKNNQDEEEDEEFSEEYDDSSNDSVEGTDASNDEWFNDDFS